MKLNKRGCDIRIRLTPCGGDFQKIQWSIGGDHHILWPSAVMGGQFSCFVNAIYCLYSEEYDSHWNCRLGWPQYRQDRDKQTDVFVTTTSVHWDEEGKTVDIKLIRRSTDYNSLKPDQYDPIEIELLYRNGRYQYEVDGRDLCYAVAKAFTNTLKKYGFKGYHCCSGSDCCRGDSPDLNQLLFIKAYALNALEVRDLKVLWSDPNHWPSAEGSSFEKEMELLMFDM